MSCRRGGLFPANDWVVLQEWERPFPAYRSGAQGDIWNHTYNWTCTNPFAANTPYELCAAVWDASGKKTVSQNVSVTRVHDYDVPEVTIIINPSTEAKEIRKLTVNKNKSIITNISNKGTYSCSTKGGAITKAELTVWKGNGLTLPAGIYYLTKLTIEDGASLNISGGTIFLSGNATLYKSSKLVAALRCLPTAGNKIDVWGNASLAGTILAPDWNVIVHEGAELCRRTMMFPSSWGGGLIRCPRTTQFNYAAFVLLFLKIVARI